MSTHHPSVVVIQGPEAGTALVIDEVLNDFAIGSDHDCHLTLSGEAMSPLHASLFLDDDGRVTVSDTKSRTGVFVNGTKVTEHELSDGDDISLGPPDDPASPRLRFVAQGSEAPLIEHLTELRKRLMFCVIGFVLAFIVSFIFSSDILYYLVLPFKWGTGTDVSLISIKLLGVFLVKLKLAFFGGIFKSLSSCEMAVSSRLSSGLPGTTAGPRSPPFRVASRESSKRFPSGVPLFAEWHL